MLFFFGVIVVGFLFLWRFGYLDWVRATSTRTETRAPAASKEVEASDYPRVRQTATGLENATTQART
jgi:hypothetical protein